MLSESELRRLYLDEKRTETEIGALCGLTQMQVNRLRQRYGIPTLTKSDRFNLPPLTDSQKALLLGSMLGDARLFATGKTTAALSEFHSEKQADYLRWKVSLWGEHICSIRGSQTHRDGKVFTGQTLRTFASKELHSYWVQFYPLGKGEKTFDQVDLTDFNAFSLAVWFLDDGCKSDNGYVRFAVTPNPSSQKVQLSLLRKFGLTPVLHTDSTGDASIWLHDQQSVTRFLELVSEHIPASMSYKLEMVPRARGSAPRDRLTENLLRAYVQQGHSVAWIADVTGTSRSSVRRALNQFCLEVSEIPELTWSEAKVRIQQGLSEDDLIATLVSLPLPEASSVEEVRRDFDNLKARTLAKLEDGVVSGGGRVGLTVCQAFFPYRYEATRDGQPSLKTAWFDERYVQKAVSFQKKVGDPVYPMNVFRALKALIVSPSNFRPAVAKKLVEDFCPPGGVVLDPCAGYGGRAVGVLAAGRKYIGVDPHPKAAKAYRDLGAALGSTLDFHNQPFEEVDLGELQADLVLTSPPYFSVERYSNDPTQSWVRYPTFDLWLQRFLHVLLAKSFNYLKAGGRALINIADCRQNGVLLPLVRETVNLARDVGFIVEGSLDMRLASFGKRQRSEPILVFRKEGGECHVPFVPVPKGQVVRGSYGTSVHGLTSDALKQLYEVELLTDLEIAQKFGVSDVLISQQRKLHQIHTITPRQREERRLGTQALPLSDLTRDKLAELYRTMSDSQIAALYRTSKVTVRNRRKAYGIPSISKTERARNKP